MKKIISVILCIVISCCVFSACSKDKEKETTTTQTTTTSIDSLTKDAKIKESDAVNLIESYTDKELGLTAKQRKECSFMVANAPVKIEKKQYIKVIAAIKKKHTDKKSGKVTYTFDYKGEYFIRFDGKEILSRDSESGEYKKMKVKAVPTTTSAETHDSETTKK